MLEILSRRTVHREESAPPVRSLKLAGQRIRFSLTYRQRLDNGINLPIDSDSGERPVLGESRELLPVLLNTVVQEHEALQHSWNVTLSDPVLVLLQRGHNQGSNCC